MDSSAHIASRRRLRVQFEHACVEARSSPHRRSAPRLPRLLLAVVDDLYADGSVGTAGAAVRVLMLTATAGFRHDSIATARQVLTSLGASTGQFTITATEDVSSIDAATLANYDVLFFALTSGELAFTAAQKASILAFVSNGGGSWARTARPIHSMSGPSTARSSVRISGSTRGPSSPPSSSKIARILQQRVWATLRHS